MSSMVGWNARREHTRDAWTCLPIPPTQKPCNSCLFFLLVSFLLPSFELHRAVFQYLHEHYSRLQHNSGPSAWLYDSWALVVLQGCPITSSRLPTPFLSIYLFACGLDVKCHDDLSCTPNTVPSHGQGTGPSSSALQPVGMQ